MGRKGLRFNFLRTFGIPFIILILASLALPSLAADFNLEDWQYSKPVSLPSGLSKEEFIEITPDLEVFRHASQGLVDLRIIEGGSQREVPYKLLVEKGERRRQSVSVHIRDLGHVPGRHSTFIADLDPQVTLHNQIEVLTTSKNFQRKAMVEGSDDEVTWTVLQEDYQIFDITIEEQGDTARSTRIPYPASTARYLRVTVFDDNQEPLDIRGAAAFFVQEIPAQYDSYPSFIQAQDEKEDIRVTQIIVDVGDYGLPNSQLTVSIPPQGNFYRRISLEGSDDARSWTPVHRGDALYVYDTPKLVQQKLTLDYPETTFRYLRLSLFNEDNPPLTVHEVGVYGFVRRLIFSVAPDASYSLYYGNQTARAPFYDLEQVFPFLVTEDLRRGSLDMEGLNLSFREKPTEPFTERHPWLLPLVVALAALALGLFLAQILRQARRALPPS